MPRPRLSIVLHLSHDEIGRRYRACRSGVEKTHWQALWLLTRPEDPPAPAAVATQLGLSAGWVRALIKRWNAEGPDGLADRRTTNNGGRHKLSVEQQIDLWAALQQAPPDGGLWTGPKVAAYVLHRWGVSVCKQTGGEWLVGLGFSLQVPRPRHPGAASAPAQRAWKRRPGESASRASPEFPREDGGVVGRG
jgi:transposase